jgi:hypothetical protein
LVVVDQMDEKKLLRELYLETAQTRMLLQDLLEVVALSAAKSANPGRSGDALIEGQTAIAQPRLLAIEVRIQEMRARLGNDE